MFPRSRARRRRDEPALDRELRALIEDHAEAVYYVAYGILHDRGLAEDVVQETMIKAWQSQHTFRGESTMRSWVLRIGHNTAIDALRRRRDQVVAPFDLAERGATSTLDDPARRAAGRADLGLLQAALDRLDATSRTVVILREVEHLSYQQIADALDLPIATVKTRLLRARRTLRAAVDDQEVDP